MAMPALAQSGDRVSVQLSDPARPSVVKASLVAGSINIGKGVALRGKVRLPADTWGWWGWGWDGFYPSDWFGGAEVVQVGGDALAFRRWEPVYDGNNAYHLDANSSLWVVDLSNPDAPSTGSVSITDDPNGWWGNMRVVGNTLYTSHYEWLERNNDPSLPWTVRYYADRIDLSDRSHPRVGSKINVRTLDGKKVALRIPAGTSNGKRFRIRGHGIERDGQKGDLIVQAEVQVPEKLTEEQERAMREFAEAGGLKY